MNDMHVSIVIPSYNHEQYIVESVLSSLGQVCHDINYEVIVVDDCSLDSSYDKVFRLSENNARLKVYKNEHNAGVSATLNKAIELSIGDYVAILGSDDLMEPNRIMCQYNFLSHNPRYSACASNVIRIDSAGEEVNKQRLDVGREVTFKEISMVGFYFPAPSVMYRRDALESVGKFRPNAKIEDWDLWLRMTGSGHQFYLLQESLTRYRIHNYSTSANHAKMFSAILEVINYNKNIVSHSKLKLIYLLVYLKKTLSIPRLFVEIIKIYLEDNTWKS